MLGLAPLTSNQQIVCYSLAVGTLIVQILAKKFVPIDPFVKIAEKAGLETENDDNQVLAVFSMAKETLNKQTTRTFSSNPAKEPLINVDEEGSDGLVIEDEGDDMESENLDFDRAREDPDGLRYSMHIGGA